MRCLVCENDGVSEIIGTMLLLGIAVIIFSVVYFSLLSTPTPTVSSAVDMIAGVEEINGEYQIVIEHRGGESIDADSQLFVDIAGIRQPLTKLGTLIQNNNDQSSWDFGEEIVYNVTEDLEGLQVDVGIAEIHSNSLVLLSTLQQGYRISNFGYGGIWHFNENSGNTAIDSSGNSNHGSILNANWTTDAKNGSALSFDGLNNLVSIAPKISLDIPQNLTMEAWVKPEDFSVELGYENFSQKFGFHADIVHVDNDVFAIVSEKQTHDIVLVTLNISSKGDIDFTQGYELNIGSGGGTSSWTSKPCITYIENDIYLVAYIESNETISLKTFYIYPNATIVETGHQVFLDEKCADPYLVNIRDTFVGLAYSLKNTGGSGKNDGIVRVLDITDSGQIDLVCNETFGNIGWFEPKLYMVYDSMLALTYSVANEGFLSTITISNLNSIEKDSGSFTINSTECYDPFLVQVQDNLSAIFYSSDAGFVKTIFIDKDGSITNTGHEIKISQDVFDSPPHGLRVSEGVVFFTFSIFDSPGTQGYFSSINVAEEGNLSFIRKPYRYETDKCFTPEVFVISDSVLGVIYRSSGDHPGAIKTFFIESDPQDFYLRVLGKKGSFGFNMNDTAVFVALNGELFSSTHSVASDGLGWYHVVVTFDGFDLKMYVNNVLINSTRVSETAVSIDETSSPLFFGKGFYGNIDEIGIYGRVLTAGEITNHYQNPGSLSP